MATSVQVFASRFAKDANYYIVAIVDTVMVLEFQKQDLCLSRAQGSF